MICRHLLLASRKQKAIETPERKMKISAETNYDKCSELYGRVCNRLAVNWGEHGPPTRIWQSNRDRDRRCAHLHRSCCVSDQQLADVDVVSERYGLAHIRPVMWHFCVGPFVWIETAAVQQPGAFHLPMFDAIWFWDLQTDYMQRKRDYIQRKPIKVDANAPLIM